jgi:hypothetical protein
MSGDASEKVVLIGLVVVGIVQMAVQPRRTLRVLRGGSWWD